MTLGVLLVEDLKHLRMGVSELLASLGDFAVVGQVATEAEAKLWLSQNRGKWDLAIIDLILEQGTGMGVIAQSKENPRGKVVVFSEYATPGIRRHCMNLGADAVFQKSSELPAFIAYCAALLRRPTAPPKLPGAGRRAK